MHAAHVGVGHLPGEADLVVEILQPVAIPDQVFRQKLEGDRLTEREVVGAVDFAHAALAQGGHDAIAAGEELARSETALANGRELDGPQRGRERLARARGRDLRRVGRHGQRDAARRAIAAALRQFTLTGRAAEHRCAILRTVCDLGPYLPRYAGQAKTATKTRDGGVAPLRQRPGPSFVLRRMAHQVNETVTP